MKMIEKELHIPIEVPFTRPLFIDIETTGLSVDRSHAYLIGVIFRASDPKQASDAGYAAGPKDRWIFRQWLAQDPLEERRIITAASEFAAGFDMLVHYNGNRFDIPYLDRKARDMGLISHFTDRPSYDLYRELKNCRKLLGLAHCHQKDFERYLGIDREDIYDGGRLIPVYHEYVRTGAPEPEHLLLIHNEEDVINMTLLTRLLPFCALTAADHPLLSRLTDCRIDPPVIPAASGAAQCASDPYPGPGADPVSGTLYLRGQLLKPVPRPAAVSLDGFSLSVRDDELRMKVPVLRGMMRYFLPHARDYWYLPAEDMAVHKDVAAFVDPAFREKATPRTCFVKKTGTFLPLPLLKDDRLTALFTSACGEFRLYRPAYGAEAYTEYDPATSLAFWECFIRSWILAFNLFTDTDR